MILLTLSPQKRGLILTLSLPAKIDDDNLTRSQPDDEFTLFTFTGRERVIKVIEKCKIILLMTSYLGVSILTPCSLCFHDKTSLPLFQKNPFVFMSS